ncbi:GrpB family protein [Arenimonas aestuarii]
MSLVTIAPYSDDWALQFSRISAELLGVFSEDSIRVEHIGSTAVPRLAAKPVLDVLLGAQSLTAIEARIGALENLGYQYVPRYEHQLPMRRYFTRAGSGDALRIHLHAVVLGSDLWRDHLVFRDALRADGSLRAEYEALKLALADTFAGDKASYTAAKEPFIRSVIRSQPPASDSDGPSRPDPLRG